MIVSEEVQYFHRGSPFTRQENDDLEKASVDDSLEGTIPLRYRDGTGGIDLEQVRRDQLQAQRQVVRAMIQRLAKLRPRREYARAGS